MSFLNVYTDLLDNILEKNYANAKKIIINCSTKAKGAAIDKVIKVCIDLDNIEALCWFIKEDTMYKNIIRFNIFLYAIKSGSLNVIQLLLSKYSLFSIYNTSTAKEIPNWKTPFTLALIHNNFSLIKFIFDQSALNERHTNHLRLNILNTSRLTKKYIPNEFLIAHLLYLCKCSNYFTMALINNAIRSYIEALNYDNFSQTIIKSWKPTMKFIISNIPNGDLTDVLQSIKLHDFYPAISEFTIYRCKTYLEQIYINLKKSYKSTRV